MGVGVGDEMGGEKNRIREEGRREKRNCEEMGGSDEGRERG